MITVTVFSLIFALTLMLLITGSYHRSVVAMLGALLVIGFGLEYGVFEMRNARCSGNLTSIGSPSNIIAIGMLKKRGKNIGFYGWFKKYAFLPCIHLLLASLYILLLVVI